MPKVTQEYIEQKKKLIVEAAARVCDKKAVCSITMQDVIDESGLSQGGIYRFYQNIDDILIDVLKWTATFSLVDSNHFTENFKKEIEELRSKKGKSQKFQRRKCIYDFIVQICNAFTFVLEKYQYPFFFIHFGFLDMILNYPERAKYIFSNASNPFSFRDCAKFIISELEIEVKDKIIEPRMPLDSIIEFLRTSFLGINQSTLVDEHYKKNIKEEKKYSADFKTRFKLIEKSCCYLLGLEEFEESK